MSDVLIDVSQRISQIHIGYQGENEANQVVFDISSWIDEYGNGEAVLHILRNGEKLPYAKDCTIDGTNAIWVIDDIDTARSGRGVAQLVYKKDNIVKKNATYTTVVGTGVENPDGSYVPDVYQSYLENMQEYYDGAAESAAAAEAAIADISDYMAAAETYATNASTSATNASTSATSASTYANNASASATQADTFAGDSEAWAVGQIDGVDVQSSHTTYHNNSKYYAQQSNAYASDANTAKTGAEAAQSAAQSFLTQASNSATTAQTHKTAAEAWAVGKENGTDVASTHTNYHNNSKYYSEQSAAFANEANAAIDIIEDIIEAYSGGAVADVQVNGSSVVQSGIAYINLTEFDDVIEVYPISGTTELSAAWLSLTSGGTAITPMSGKIYILLTDSESYSTNQQFRWNGSAYTALASSATAITTTFIDTLMAS